MRCGVGPEDEDGIVGVKAELECEVAGFVNGHLSLDDLEDWLSLNAVELATLEDPEAQRLSGRAWTLICEYAYGHRSEDDARRILGDLERMSPIRVTLSRGSEI